MGKIEDFENNLQPLGISEVDQAQRLQLQLCMGSLATLLATGKSLFTKDDLGQLMDEMLDRYTALDSEPPLQAKLGDPNE